MYTTYRMLHTATPTPLSRASILDRCLFLLPLILYSTPQLRARFKRCLFPAQLSFIPIWSAQTRMLDLRASAHDIGNKRLTSSKVPPPCADSRAPAPATLSLHAQRPRRQRYRDCGLPLPRTLQRLRQHHDVNANGEDDSDSQPFPGHPRPSAPYPLRANLQSLLPFTVAFSGVDGPGVHAAGER